VEHGVDPEDSHRGALSPDPAVRQTSAIEQGAGGGPASRGSARAMADNEAKKTTDHDQIRRWAEERGGKPAKVKGTESGPDDPGILRIDFPGVGEEDGLEEIPWDEWFEKFDEENLAFLHQDEVKSGEESRFFKLVKR
jgi:hypothetical protein